MYFSANALHSGLLTNDSLQLCFDGKPFWDRDCLFHCVTGASATKVIQNNNNHSTGDIHYLSCDWLEESQSTVFYSWIGGANNNQVQILATCKRKVWGFLLTLVNTKLKWTFHGLQAGKTALVQKCMQT